MARVQLVIADEDRDRFVHQARREGMTLSAWLRAAAHERLQERQRAKPFQSPEDLEEFFRACDRLEGPETEPDWDRHLDLINQSRRRGTSDT
ncbi:MAG: antitoxin [Acidobacteriota bacterium]|nr:antitoxin [Acidobacteriota bacterium]MDE2964047.1 antitoxin [Acidobacteriota bacterium]